MTSCQSLTRRSGSLDNEDGHFPCPVVDDLQQVPSLLGVQRFGTPLVDDQQASPLQGQFLSGGASYDRSNFRRRARASILSVGCASGPSRTLAPQEASTIPFRLHRRIPLLRRPFHQRDQARMERDAALAERNLLVSDCRAARKAVRMNWVRHRPIEDTRGSGGTSDPIQSNIDDLALVRRIVASYQAASATAVGDPNSFWLTEFAKIKQNDHDVLSSGSDAVVAELLRNPAKCRLFVGFDELHDHTGLPEHGITNVISTPEWLYDGLLRIAEAFGVRRLAYPERLGPGPGAPEVEDLLEDLDRAAGFRITFPNPFAGEVGACNLARNRQFPCYPVSLPSLEDC